jgi:hypothetical protein
VVFGQHRLLLRVRATHGRAITIIARRYAPRTDTLNPRDFVRMLHIGRAQNLARVRTRRAEQAFVIHTRYDVGKFAVPIFFFDFGIVRFETGREQNRADLDFFFLDRLIEINRFIFADRFADFTLLVFEIETTVVNVCNERNRLGKINVNRFVV